MPLAPLWQKCKQRIRGCAWKFTGAANRLSGRESRDGVVQRDRLRAALTDGTQPFLGECERILRGGECRAHGGLNVADPVCSSIHEGELVQIQQHAAEIRETIRLCRGDEPRVDGMEPEIPRER